MPLKIVDNQRLLDLSRGECLVLELSLNVSSNNYNYKSIGDQLYKYYCSPCNPGKVIVTPEQYDFLVLLKSKKSWKDCYNI